jgi:two-component system, LuxR family, sensor kinase FixL
VFISSDSHTRAGGTQAEAEHFIQSALDALAAHIAILDRDGYIIGVNAAWKQFADANNFTASNYGVGLNYLEVCDTSIHDNSLHAAAVATGIRKIISGHQTEFEVEYPCHSPHERRWFVVRISRFDWYTQARLVVAHQNVTELRQAQVELAASKRRIELIVENINNGIMTIDGDGRVETANTAAARIFGYMPGELQGMTLGQLITAYSGKHAKLPRLNYETDNELTGVRKDNSTFPIYLSLSELRLDDGSLYTCIVKDITIRRQIEAERLEREKLQVALEKERELRDLKNRFLSMMSNELRTPLASISLSYDMLKKYSAVSTPDEKDQALENIRIQVEYLADMVTDVLTLSRSEAEGLGAMLEDADLITCCRDVVEEFHFQFHRTHDIEFECTERSLRAPIDRKLLRRALTNLLSNAVKYTPTGGSVVFRLSQDGEYAMIEVSDTGIGIPPDDRMRLFEPFHRAGNASSIPGTGLGLPITRQAVELHQGTIDFITGSEGTTFIIRLPLHRD